MLDNVVIIPVEMSNEDLAMIIEVSKRVNMSRNETIRMLIRLGLQKLLESEAGMGAGMSKSKRGDKK